MPITIAQRAEVGPNILVSGEKRVSSCKFTVPLFVYHLRGRVEIIWSWGIE